MTTINIKTLDGLLEIFGSYQSIVNALGYVPANADGVLTNEYFKDLDGDNFVISDKSGNIIAKIDKNGLETTKVKATKFEGDVTGNLIGNVNGTVEGNVIGNLKGNVEGDVTGNVTGNVNADLVEVGTLIADTIQNTDENYIIADNSGNMILKVDSNGLETTKVKATEFEGDVTGNLIGNVTGNVNGTVEGNVIGNLKGNVEGDVTGNVTGNVNAELITVGTLIAGTIQNTDENYVIADNSGNMILKVDSNGLETTKVKATEFEGDVTGNLKGNADTSTYSQSSGHSASADKVLNKLTINAGTSTSTTSIEYDGSSEQSITITPASLGLTSAMIYIGTSTTEIKDGGNQKPTIGGKTITPTAGNVVIYNNKEFIYNGSNWEVFGDEMNHKVIQTPVSTPSADGATKAFIDTIEQDANGNITVTKKTFDESTLNSDNITTSIINVTDIATINKVKTDNLEQSGNNFIFTDSNNNVIATVDGTGIRTTTVTATKFIGDLEGNATSAGYAEEAGHANSAANATNAEHATSADTATSAGIANTAITATNLDTKPVFTVGTDTNKITVTVGNKKSDEFTVPYATKADSANSANSADTATNAVNATNAEHATSADTATSAGTANTAITATNLDTKPVFTVGTDTNKITVTAGNKKSDEFTVPYATKADSANSALNAENATNAANATNAEHAISADTATSAGTANTAITATNLDTKPVLAIGTNTNKITVTAGNKKSDEFTVPYATKADSANSALNAENATNASNATNAEHAISADTATSAGTANTATTSTNLDTKPVLAIGTNTNKITVTAGNKKSDEFTVPYATNAEHAISADTATNAANTTNAEHATSADTATSAGIADKLNTNAGTNTKPIYFKNGIPVECESISLNVNAQRIDVKELYAENIKGTVSGNAIKWDDITGIPDPVNINISGNAESANKLNTDAGTNKKPIYFTNGIPTQCDDTLDVNIDWNNIINPPNETDTISGHTHSFTPNGSIESEFESTEHNHTFESTAHTHEITDNGHNHSINNIIDEVSLETNYNEGTRKLKINIAVSKTNINTDTKTTNISINNASVEGNIGNTTVTGNVTSTFSGETLETTENGEHNHKF